MGKDAAFGGDFVSVFVGGVEWCTAGIGRGSGIGKRGWAGMRGLVEGCAWEVGIGAFVGWAWSSYA